MMKLRFIDYFFLVCIIAISIIVYGTGVLDGEKKVEAEKGLLCRHVDVVKTLDISECDKVEGIDKNVFIQHDLVCLVQKEKYEYQPRYCRNKDSKKWNMSTSPTD